MTVEMTDTTTIDQDTRVSFLWLKITGKCQLACEHCYADSGPAGSHGSMTGADWMRVIDEAAELDVDMVQFIGGEPTLHPEFDAFVRHALSRGLKVEVYTNLVRVTPEQWALFELPGVRLATSYYSDELCGNCGHGVLAVGPDGSIWPCVFSRWMSVGNVGESSLASILDGPSASSARRELATSFAQRQPGIADQCNPNCLPQTCQPQCGPNRQAAGECNPNCLPQTCQPQCGPNRTGRAAVRVRSGDRSRASHG